MGQLCKLVLFILVLVAVLHNSSGGKIWFGGKSTPSKKPSEKPSQGTKIHPNYPRQPSHPGAGSKPGYPNQQYPGRGGSNPGGYPNQNPGAGGFYNQNPGRSGYSPGGHPAAERHYNQSLYQHQGTHSKGVNNKGGSSNTSKLPPQAQSYDQFMNTCMTKGDLLKEQNMKDSAVRNNIKRDESLTDYLGMNEDYLEKGEPEKNNTASTTTVSDYPNGAGIHNDEDDDTVSIVQIGYPALIEQMKACKCVEQYLVYSESFPEKQKEKSFGNHNGHRVSGVLLLLTTSFMLLGGTVAL